MAILKDKSKKKKGENIIGKIIYGFLLFMPLIAVGVACFYVMFNKNAYQSYSDKYVERLQLVNNANSMIENQNYIAIYTEDNTTTTYGAWITYNSININWQDYGFENYTYNQFRLFNNGLIQLKTEDNTTYQRASIWGNTLKQFTFNFKTIQNESFNNGYVRYYQIVYEQQSLDNVFYYQLERLEESDLFNWTKNTGAYTVMHNVTSGIGISNTYTPMLMTYWLLISVIYFIFDIALILVWAVHDKIHELKDAI